MTYKRCLFFTFIIYLFLLMRVESFAKQHASINQISEIIEKIKTSTTSTMQRHEAAGQLYDLTRKINAKNIDDKTLNDIIELLDIPETRVRIAASLANLKSRSKIAIPKMLQVLNDEVCDNMYVDLISRTGISAEDVIRSSLKQMGVKNPLIDCGGNYSASDLSNTDLKKAVVDLAKFQTGNQTHGTSLNIRRNGEIYKPDGIELVYVEGTNNAVTVIKDYYIGKYEITQEQWSVLMGRPPRSVEGKNLPVDYVSLDDIQEFLLRLNTATGRNYRLPTEEEWGYAARGGNAESFCLNRCKYSGSDDIDDVAWYSGSNPRPVGTKQPNELGIYDMSGNVWEWVSDLYVGGGSRPKLDTKNHDSGLLHVVRGCGWSSGFAQICPVTSYSVGYTDARYRALGFRVVLPFDVEPDF